MIDYNTIFLNLFWMAFIFILVNIFFESISLKIFFIILFCFPFLLISVVGFNGENFLYFFRYLIFFILKPKLYFYLKN